MAASTPCVLLSDYGFGFDLQIKPDMANDFVFVINGGIAIRLTRLTPRFLLPIAVNGYCKEGMS
jgi:hypothetical protein